MSRKESKYIDYLDENGWHLILNNQYEEKESRKKNNFLKRINLLLIIPCVLFLTFPKTYSKYIIDTQSETNVKVATWNFKVNSTSTEEINLDLADTLVANNYSDNYVIPGSEGIINVDIDFSNTKVATYYKISIDTTKTNIPENLKFYIDEDKTIELTDLTGSVSLDDINNKITKKIYWKWNFTETDETIDWSKKDISINLQVIGQQDV